MHAECASRFSQLNPGDPSAESHDAYLQELAKSLGPPIVRQPHMPFPYEKRAQRGAVLRRRARVSSRVLGQRDQVVFMHLYAAPILELDSANHAFRKAVKVRSLALALFDNANDGSRTAGPQVGRRTSLDLHTV